MSKGCKDQSFLDYTINLGGLSLLRIYLSTRYVLSYCKEDVLLISLPIQFILLSIVQTRAFLLVIMLQERKKKISGFTVEAGSNKNSMTNCVYEVRTGTFFAGAFFVGAFFVGAVLHRCVLASSPDIRTFNVSVY